MDHIIEFGFCFDYAPFGDDDEFAGAVIYWHPGGLGSGCWLYIPR
jgi:hypothetical protein